MSGPIPHGLRLPLAALATAITTWWLLPGTPIDHFAFTSSARTYANPPFFITGDGTHTNPWKLRIFSSNTRPDPQDSPCVVALDDDLEGFFQSSPPSPIDLAVILTNFQRLGATKAASAAVLAWDAPDPIGLAALDIAIGRFDSLVMAAPLSRAAVPEHLPPAFRRASLPLNAAHGDVSALPVVNRLPLPGVILGSAENTLAGFQSLDSATTGRQPPLIARWDDRLVFAFPVLAAIQHLSLPIEGMEIRLGEYLKLSASGPTVPIDSFGRLTVPLKSIAPRTRIPAEAIIDAEPGIFPQEPPSPVILADHMSAAEPATRAFSDKLPFMVATLTSGGGLSPAIPHRRPPAGSELLMLAAVALFIPLFGKLPPFSRNLAFFSAAAACIATQFIASAGFSLWLPGSAALASIGVAYAISILQKPEPATAATRNLQPSPKAKPEPKVKIKSVKPKKPKPDPIPPAPSPQNQTEPGTSFDPSPQPEPPEPPPKPAKQRAQSLKNPRPGRKKKR